MRKLIYFVEDDISINALIEETLTQNDFEAYGFYLPTQFLKRLQKVKPDLIVLDLMLPEMSGYDIIKYLKSKKEYENIPVIILSAKSQESDIVKGLDMGANDYITKPFGLNEFISRINSNLRKFNMQEGKTYVIGELSLNTTKHEFKVNDNIIELRTKEFDIMEILLESPEQIVTRTRLLRDVWGIDCDIETRTLDMHIKELRKKIALYTESTYIETVRGVGYIVKVK